jgi:hypothetical protein
MIIRIATRLCYESNGGINYKDVFKMSYWEIAIVISEMTNISNELKKVSKERR